MKPVGILGTLCLILSSCLESSSRQSLPERRIAGLDSCSDSSYMALLTRIHNQKKNFATWYQTAPDKTKVLDSCSKYLERCFADSLFRHWEHTPWEFYGTSQVPKCGAIACGYFVTTLLRDLGFDIPRVRWAEVASETFIREFCSNKVYHYIGKECEEVVDAIQLKKGNYFLVGLDTHVGIIEKTDTAVNFIHSAYFAAADGVTREPALGYNPFSYSNYRVFGEIFTSDHLLDWMMGKKYE